MSTILEDIKTLVEVDAEEDIYDTQLLLIINGGIAYLRNNGVPLSRIDKNATINDWPKLSEDDYPVVIDWLNYRVLQNFDRTLMLSYSANTTNNFIDYHMTDLLYQLKVRYEFDEVN